MNFRKNLEYKRLYILQPSYYQKLVNVYDKHRQASFNSLDKDIYEILFNKSLNENQKYYSYLSSLNKKIGEFKKVSPISEQSESFQPFIPDLKADISQQSVNTEQKPKFYTTIETQTSPKKFRNKGIQTEADEKPSETPLQKPVEEDVYEHVPEQASTNNHFLEVKLHEIAQEYLKEPSSSNVVLDKKTLEEDYRIFNNISNNDSIAIQVKPVFDLMYGNKEEINWRVDKENKDLDGRYILLSESVEKPRKRKPSLIKPSASENVLEKTLFDLALENSNIETTANDLLVDQTTLNKNFRVFHNNKTGDKVAIEVSPVQDNLLNKTTDIDLEVEVKKNKKNPSANFIVLRSRSIQKKRSKSRQRSSSKKPRQKSSTRQTGKGLALQWTIM